jgi:hypothetical protein
MILSVQTITSYTSAFMAIIIVTYTDLAALAKFIASIFI